MQVFERQVLHIYRKYLAKEGDRDILAEQFLAAVKKSPEEYTISYAITLAIVAEWHDVLPELFAIDLSGYKSVRCGRSYQSPLSKAVLKLCLPSAHLKGRGGYSDNALAHAIVSKRVETVKFLARFMNFNAESTYSEYSLLPHLYSLDDQEVKNQMREIIFPKLSPSLHLEIVAGLGELEDFKHFVERLHPDDRYLICSAGRDAMRNGHDHIVKWIVGTPYAGDESCIFYFMHDALHSEKLDMLEYLAEHAPGLPMEHRCLGTTEDLWKFLRKKNRLELFSKFYQPGEHDQCHLLRKMNQLSLKQTNEEESSTTSSTSRKSALIPGMK